MKRWLLALLGVFVVAQLIPVPRDNPTVVEPVIAPKAIEHLLRRACYDCHSNETRWPAYAYVAPASWLVSYDAHAGRKHLNFSDWGRSKHRGDIAEVLSEGEMPPWYYSMVSADRRLSVAERAQLVKWAQAFRGGDGHAGAEARDDD